MLLGGEPLGPRHIWWNFVSSRKERIEQAKADCGFWAPLALPAELKKDVHDPVELERLAHEVAAVEKIKPEAATAKLEKLLNAA